MAIENQTNADNIFLNQDEATLYIRSRWKKWMAIIVEGIFILASLSGLWYLIYWFLNTNILPNPKINGSDIITVVFNISSSTLALVSLVTIFVSINSQHRIQRSREIIWNLMELPYQCWGDRGNFVYKFSLEQRIRHYFISYKQVTKSGKTFSNVVVLFVFIIIAIVSAMITVTIQVLKFGYFTNPSEFTFLFRATLIGAIMMLCFAVLVLSLSRISFIGSLPKLYDLLNANALNTGVHSILLAAVCMRIIPSKTVMLRIAFPFQNMDIFPWIVGTLKQTNEEVLLLGGPFEQTLDKRPLIIRNIDSKRGHRLRYLLLSDFDSDLYSKISYKFELQSKQGKVFVDFEQSLAGNTEKEDWLHPIGIAPKLTSENELFQENTLKLF